MSYATEQNLIDRFGEDDIRQVADRDGDGVNDAAAIAGAIGDAGDTIDAYVGSRYDLPLVSVPPRLVRVACELAFYYLHRFSPPEHVRKLYEDAMKFLGDVSTGRAKLDIAGDDPAPAGDTIAAEGPDRTFSHDTLKDF